jgi:hypothetical protein
MFMKQNTFQFGFYTVYILQYIAITNVKCYANLIDYTMGKVITVIHKQ